MRTTPSDPNELRVRERAFREDRDRRVVRLPRRQLAARDLHDRLTQRTYEMGTSIVHDDGMISWSKTRKPTPYFSPTYRIWYEKREWPIVFFQEDGTETVVTFVTDPRSPFVGRRAAIALWGLVVCAATLASGDWIIGGVLALVSLVLLRRVYRASDVVLDAAVHDLMPLVAAFPTHSLGGEKARPVLAARVPEHDGGGNPTELEEVADSDPGHQRRL